MAVVLIVGLETAACVWGWSRFGDGMLLSSNAPLWGLIAVLRVAVWFGAITLLRSSRWLGSLGSGDSSHTSSWESEGSSQGWIDGHESRIASLEARLPRCLERAGFGVLKRTGSGRIVAVNARFLELSQRRQRDLIAESPRLDVLTRPPVSCLLPTYDTPAVQGTDFDLAALEDSIRRLGVAPPLEVELIRGDARGQTLSAVPTLLFLSPVGDPRDPLARYEIFVEVSDLRERIDALSLVERRHRALAELVPTPIWRADAQGVLLDWNAAAEALFRSCDNSPHSSATPSHLNSPKTQSKGDLDLGDSNDHNLEQPRRLRLTDILEQECARDLDRDWFLVETDTSLSNTESPTPPPRRLDVFSSRIVRLREPSGLSSDAVLLKARPRRGPDGAIVEWIGALVPLENMTVEENKQSLQTPISANQKSNPVFDPASATQNPPPDPSVAFHGNATHVQRPNPSQWFAESTIEVNWRDRVATLEMALKVQRCRIRQLEAMIEAAPVGLFLINSQGRVTTANRMARYLMDWDSSESELDLVDQKIAFEDQALRLEWRQSLEERTRFDRELRITRASDAEPIWIRLQTVPIPDADRRREMVGLVEEITHHVLQEQRMRQALEAADAANRAKSEFLAHMSHEIRNPLSVVLGHADMLADDSNSREQRQALIELIRRDGAYLNQIIDDILDLTRMERGELRLNPQPTLPDQLLEQVVESNQALASAKHIALVKETDSSGKPLPLCLLEPVRMRQILVNLIGNAIKFTSSGTIWVRLWSQDHLPPVPPCSLLDPPSNPETPLTLSTDHLWGHGLLTRIDPEARRVAVSRREPGFLGGSTVNRATGWLTFEVEDTGIGIGIEELGNLFQAFRQGDGSINRRFGGTGLGLYICRELVERLGGRIDVRSVKGQGCRFSVHLPMIPATADPTEGTPADSSRTRARNNGERLRRSSKTALGAGSSKPLEGEVLVVEDNLDVQRVIRFYLKRLGLTVESADNGQDAVQRVLSHPKGPDGFDLIFTDVQMPVMDGFELVRRLRQAGRTKPIVALTARAMEDDRIRCLNSGCDDHLSKPIDFNQLAGLVRSQLQTQTQVQPTDEKDVSHS